MAPYLSMGIGITLGVLYPVCLWKFLNWWGATPREREMKRRNG